MVTKMMNLRAFFDIYEEVFFKATFLTKMQKEDFLTPFCKVSEIAKISREINMTFNSVQTK